MLVASSSVLSHVGEASKTAPQQLRAYADAVWRKPPSHIDMHMKVRVVRNGEVEYHLQRFHSDGESRRVDTVKQSEDQWGETQHFKESRITGRITDAGSLTEITVYTLPEGQNHDDQAQPRTAASNPQFQRTIWRLNLCILIGMGISFVSRILYRCWKARESASH